MKSSHHEPGRRGDGPARHHRAERSEQEASDTHALLAREAEVEPHRECEPSERHLHDGLERRERVAADQTERPRPKHETERDVLDARRKARAADRAPAHEKAAQIRQHQ